MLVEEVLELLGPERGGLFVDCTLGPGGHAEALLERGPQARLVGVDRDRKALSEAARRLEAFRGRTRLVEGDYRDLPELLTDEERRGVAGILADLGVSSLQLDSGARGFSFRRDGPLDMRMGDGDLTAYDVVNRYEEAELERILREYGEERHARRIARAIARQRDRTPIHTTSELRDLIHRVRGGRRGERLDPATRVFQALRIEVNRELEGLDRFLEQAIRLLQGDGRLVVISYHSLEDRVVKHTLRDLARGEVDPVTGRSRSETRLVEVLTRRPLRPAAEEVASNPRARSARLRAARRL